MKWKSESWKKTARTFDQTYLLLFAVGAMYWKDDATSWLAILLLMVGRQVNKVLWKMEDAENV